jgi:hypothetical protein
VTPGLKSRRRETIALKTSGAIAGHLFVIDAREIAGAERTIRS